MQIIGTTTKAAALAALLALGGLLPATAAEPGADARLVQTSAADLRAPSDEQVVALADRSMRVFMASVREKSMQALWDHISPRFREMYSVAQLDEAFKAFYSLPITGDPLAGKSPVFSADPRLDVNSNLIVDGYYTTTPSRMIFRLVFAMEGRAWKVIGINVNVQPMGQATRPDSGGVTRNPEPDMGCRRGQACGA